MFRFLIPIILIVISVAGFLMFTGPFYAEVGTLRTQGQSYNEALDNSKALENERDKLTQKYNSIDPANLDKLTKLIPDNVDNIRLILEIEKIALPYGMTLKDVKYDTEKEDAPTAPAVFDPAAPQQIENSIYGTWDLSFSTSATYANFVNFVRDLESNLRIVDIVSIDFSSDTGQGASPALADMYKYDFKIKTYWLKN